MAEQQKKMNVMQLTFIVTVNMMGSGIIMLPANMVMPVIYATPAIFSVTAIGSAAGPSLVYITSVAPQS